MIINLKISEETYRKLIKRYAQEERLNGKEGNELYKACNTINSELFRYKTRALHPDF